MIDRYMGSKTRSRKLAITFALFTIIVLVIFTAQTIAISDVYASSAPESATSPTVYDNFDDNATDKSEWKSETGGTGTTINEVGQRLEISHEATASGSPFFGQYVSTCKISGDFDIQVDYQLLQWPSTNGIVVGLAVRDPSTSSIWATERVSVGENERYLANGEIASAGDEAYFASSNGISDRGEAIISGMTFTTDTSGTLRQVRSGSTITGYSGSDMIGTFTSASIDDVHFILASWGYDISFGDTDVKVAFDNMKINSGSLVNCSPAYLVKNLIETLLSMGQQEQFRNSLFAPLRQAEQILTDNNENNDKSACGKMDGFMAVVDAKYRKGDLTQDQAIKLIEMAGDVKSALGCK